MPAHMVVGVDAHIDPAECSVLTEISGEFATPQRADVGIGPYSQVGKCIRIRREFLMIRCILLGGQSRPPLQTSREYVQIFPSFPATKPDDQAHWRL